MNPIRSSLGRWAAVLGGLLVLVQGAHAETKTVRIAKQFGVSYLPLTIMEEKKLLEEHGKKLGLDVTAEWLQFTGGTPINEALISGNLDIASGGVGPFLTIWGRTRGNIGVKGVAALNSMPLYLNTINPNVKSLKDFTDKDKIALPGVRTSIQAITLQMGAEKQLGAGQHGKLDPLTVSMGHPDGQTAMMSGRSEISAHFTSAPYMYDELADPRVHKVLDSYDVLGGPHSFNVVWTTTRFRTENPQVMKAFVAALDDAMKRITADPAAAAAIWIKADNSKMSAADAEKMIRNPENEWTTTPKKIMTYAEFMNRTGILSAKPASWQDVFFEEVHNLPGS